MEHFPGITQVTSGKKCNRLARGPSFAEILNMKACQPFWISWIYLWSGDIYNFLLSSVNINITNYEWNLQVVFYPFDVSFYIIDMHWVFLPASILCIYYMI